ncbi:MAG: hypothetical protein FD168_2165 [Desulfobulbaceae bacterium]|nr:MAG: hypothetical protein FD168_2165 [Desulfobulbaceae bacterium]
MEFSKENVVEAYRHVMIVFCLFFITGCAASGPKKLITELYEPMYQPGFNYTPKQEQKSPAGYTVGIINMKFDYESIPAKSWELRTDLEKQYTKNFIQSYSSSLEKTLMSKGITVSGPFDSYEDMTYPERSRCDFLVQPIVKIVLHSQFSNVQDIPEYSGPKGQGFIYKKATYDLTATAEMEYVIYDPLTKEKLERHKITSDPITKSTNLLAIKHIQKDSKGDIIKESWVNLSDDPDHKDEHNGDIIYGKIIDDLFGKYMSKVDGLISVEEFNHLKKYKNELKEKKVY